MAGEAFLPWVEDGVVVGVEGHLMGVVGWEDVAGVGVC